VNRLFKLSSNSPRVVWHVLCTHDAAAADAAAPVVRHGLNHDGLGHVCCRTRYLHSCYSFSYCCRSLCLSLSISISSSISIFFLLLLLFFTMLLVALSDTSSRYMLLHRSSSSVLIFYEKTRGATASSVASSLLATKSADAADVRN
jgi:hypothetical protein